MRISYWSSDVCSSDLVALQLASLTFMVPMGLAQAATVRVGVGYGRADAAHIRRAGWTSFVMGTGFMAAMALIMLAIPGTLAGQIGRASGRERRGQAV